MARLFRRLFGIGEPEVRPRLDVMVDDDEDGGDGDATGGYPRGSRGGIRMILSAPSVQFVVGHSRAQERMNVMDGLGFRFRERFVGLATVATAVGSVTVELASMEEFIALQRLIGLPIRLEDGALEIVGD